MSLDYTPNEIARFWSKVKLPKQIGTDECWEWQASTRSGYGQFHIRPAIKVRAYAHRVAYDICNGAIPSGLFVCHHCDNKLCVNPAHLYAGTQIQNSHDAIIRGQQPRGESHGMVKLTNAKVIEIKKLLALGENQSKIANRFGVTSRMISRINTGKAWTHIEVSE